MPASKIHIPIAPRLTGVWDEEATMDKMDKVTITKPAGTVITVRGKHPLVEIRANPATCTTSYYIPAEVLAAIHGAGSFEELCNEVISQVVKQLDKTEEMPF